MKVVPLVLMALLAGSPFAILALDTMGVGADFQVEAPDWAPGATWEWDVVGRGRAVGEGFGLVRFESDTLRVDATRRAEVLNTTMATEGGPIDLVLEAFRVDQVRHGDEVVYAGGEDETVPRDASEFAQDFFCITPCGTFLATYQDGNPNFGAHAFGDFGSDEMRLVDFPLTRGKTWNVVHVEEEGVLFQIEAKAVDHEYVTLPGRSPVPAIRIEATLTEASKDAIEQVVREEAAKEELTIHLDLDLRATYWYAPDLQNLVKLDLDGFVAGRGVGYGAAAQGRVDFHLDQVLTKASLTPARERTLEEAHALVGATRDAAGEAPRSSTRTFDFQVGASALSVHADEGQSARFGLVTDARQRDADTEPVGSFDAAPADARIVWTQDKPDGAHERSEGETATFSFDTPGLHVVRAAVYDVQGRLMGTDQVLVEAYTRETYTIGSEAPLGTPLKEQYDVTAFHVADGASAAHVTLQADGAASGTLRIAGEAADQEEHVELVSGTAAFEVADLSSGTRTLTWHEEARAGPISVTLEVRYARVAPSPLPA